MTNIPMEHMRILLVNGDEEERTELSLMLSQQGHEILGAATGRIGLDLLKTGNPNVLCLGLHLGDMTRTDLSQRNEGRLGYCRTAQC